jgi:hypothetical protein
LQKDHKSKNQNYNGYGKVGDEQLTERFNPNNAEMNKIRFMKEHGQMIGASKKGPKGAKFSNK